jgi:hypothetical protein
MELFNEKIEGLKEAYLRDVDAMKDIRISPFSLTFALYQLSYKTVEQC